VRVEFCTLNVSTVNAAMFIIFDVRSVDCLDSILRPSESFDIRVLNTILFRLKYTTLKAKSTLLVGLIDALFDIFEGRE